MKRKQVVAEQQVLFDVDNAIKPTPSPNREKGIDSYIFDMLDALKAPILTFSQAWADTIPNRLLDIILTARVIALKKEEELATFPECSAYIYTRTLESPMDSDWTNIYTHVSCCVCQDWFNEDHWEEVQAPKRLTDWQESKLNKLRRHLYERRRKILKERMKSEDNYFSKETKPVKEKVKSTPGNLSSLFSE